MGFPKRELRAMMMMMSDASDRSEEDHLAKASNSQQHKSWKWEERAPSKDTCPLLGEILTHETLFVSTQRYDHEHHQTAKN